MPRKKEPTYEDLRADALEMLAKIKTGAEPDANKAITTFQNRGVIARQVWMELSDERVRRRG